MQIRDTKSDNISGSSSMPAVLHVGEARAGCSDMLQLRAVTAVQQRTSIGLDNRL